MPKKAKQVQAQDEQVQPTVEPAQPAPLSATRDDYLRARATIQLYREQQKTRPKRKCSDKQLAALAAGRARNQRFAKKQESSDSTN